MTEERMRELHAELLSVLVKADDPGDEEVRAVIARLLAEESRKRYLPIRERTFLARALFDSVRRLGLLQELMDDETVTEIMVNGREDIFYERNGKIARWDRTFPSTEKLEDIIRQIAGRCDRVINERNPIVDARLPDGSRVHAVTAPAVIGGPVLTIRKFPSKAITMRELLARGSLTDEAADFLTRLVGAGYSVLIGGGTSAGKTTFLNALSESIPKGERIITIEDNAELQIQGIPNLVRLEAKRANAENGTEITIRDLIRASLRMRPDRIIVGEVRGGEAVDMLQALNTGHDGSMSTIHANSCRDLLSRLEVMVMLGEPGMPPEAIRRQIASGIEILVHLARLKDGSRRVTEIAETETGTDGQVLCRTLYLLDRRSGVFRKTGELRHREKLERV